MRCYAKSSAFRPVNATAAAISPPTVRNEGSRCHLRPPIQPRPPQHQHAGHTNARDREDHPGRQPRASRGPDPNRAGGDQQRGAHGRPPRRQLALRPPPRLKTHAIVGPPIPSRVTAGLRVPSQVPSTTGGAQVRHQSPAGQFKIQPRRGANSLSCAGVAGGARPQPRPTVARRGYTTVRGPPCLHAEALLPAPQGLNPVVSRVTFATPSRPDRRGALLRSTKSMARHRGRGRGRITIMPSASALSRRRIDGSEIRNQTRTKNGMETEHIDHS